MLKPTVKGIERVRKQYGLGKNSSLNLAQYKEAIDHSRAKSNTYSFVFSFLVLDVDKVVIRVVGNHISKNRYNSLSFKDKLRYKKAIKSGAYDFYRCNKKKIDRFATLQKAVINFVFYSKRSRDHDNNADTIKMLQDVMVQLGFVVDDKRDVLACAGVDEVIIKGDAMVEVTIKAS